MIQANDLMRPHPGDSGSCLNRASTMCALVNVPAFRNQPLSWADSGNGGDGTLFLMGGYGFVTIPAVSHFSQAILSQI